MADAMTWRNASAVLSRRDATDPSGFAVEFVRLGDLTPERISRLRREYGFPDTACPLCEQTGSYLMRVVTPALTDTHRKLYGEEQATTLLRLGLPAKCLCLATRPPREGDGEAKARRLRDLDLPDAETVAGLGLDFGWRPTEKKRTKRRSFEDATQEIEADVVLE